MTLWTPVFQRSENCGDRSPKPVTVSLTVSNRDRVTANGPTSTGVVRVRSSMVRLRP